MRDLTRDNFGILIAYLLPGFILLWGTSLFSDTIRTWLGASTDNSPSIGGFLYVTLAATGAGLFTSTLRWLVIDRLHHWTGIAEPRLNFARLGQELSAFELLVASHYAYYKFYANTLIAVVLTSAAYAIADPASRTAGRLLLVLALVTVLWLGSRDTLRKYYRRAETLMSSEAQSAPLKSRTKPR